MKKLIFIFAMLVSFAHNLSAQHTNPEALVNEFQSIRRSMMSWDSVQGSENDKILAITLGKPVQLQDSVIVESYRWLGVLLIKEYSYHRYLFYDRENKLFKQSVQLYQEKLHYASYVSIVCSFFFVFFLLFIFNTLKMKSLGDRLFFLVLLFLLLIFLSYYLGTFCLIVYLFHTYRHKTNKLIDQLRFKNR